nr:MAG TPA: hypothetical protein [Caudoviricetes sp.]
MCGGLFFLRFISVQQVIYRYTKVFRHGRQTIHARRSILVFHLCSIRPA